MVVTRVFPTGPFLYLISKERSKNKVLWPWHFRDLLEVLASICSAELYEFPVAAVTSGRTLSGLKQHTVILLKFWGSESEMRHQGCVPSGSSGGAAVSWPFPASIGCLHSLSRGPTSL